MCLKLRSLWPSSFLGISLVLTGCQPQPKPTVAPADPWVLETSDMTTGPDAILWNGVIGLRASRQGLISELYDIRQYEPKGEEKIKSVPTWFPPELTPPGARQNYHQSLNLKTGELFTRWDGFRQTWRLVPGQPQLLVGGEGDRLVDFREETVKDVDQAFVKDLNEYWERFWETDIVIEGDPEAQKAIRAMLFYLRTSINPGEDRSIAPVGLSGTTYFGHVFWDADVWVFPALMLLDPERARSITNYRLARVAQAHQNYLDWQKAGRPTGSAPLVRGVIPPPGIKPLKFPWESSLSGRETVPGPSRFQEHISGSVAHAIEQGLALGLVPKESGTKLLDGVGAYFLARSERIESGELALKGTMSPDEYHTGDNDLYTNLLAERYGKRIGNFDWVRPRDKTSLLTYDQDGLRAYKQAAALLAVYPLQDSEAEAQWPLMMERFAGKVIKNGPAMSESIHSVILARGGKPEEAYEYFSKSWKPFMTDPFLQFSEKRHKPITYFTTGAGGCLQAVLFGFAGLRLDTSAIPGASWSLKLNEGKFLSCKPNLPPKWKRLEIRGLKVLGKTYTVRISGNKSELIPAKE